MRSADGAIATAVLVSRNDNRITLFPGTVFIVGAVTDRGESHRPVSGKAEFDVRRALDETVVAGVETTLPLHRRLAANEDVIAGDYDIHWLENWAKRQKGAA